MGRQMGQMCLAILAGLALAGCAQSPLSRGACGASCAIDTCAPTSCATNTCATDTCATDTCATGDCATGCNQGRGVNPGDWYGGVSLSAIPGIGFGVHAGRVFLRNDKISLSAEIEAMAHVIDDETFLDDGNPEADGHYQIKAGIKMSDNPKSLRHWVVRAGLTYFHAGANPNVVQDEGDYVGVYAGVGLETDLTPNFTFGPDLSLTLATRTEDVKIVAVPTLSWRATWWLCGNGASGKHIPGEVYVDLMGGVLPTFGGGVGLGQVFSRTSLATWSIETSAVFMPLSDTLQGESDGDFGAFRGGVKATFNPCARGHWVARAGAAFLRNTGDVSSLAMRGDYVGFYAGLGYEWDLTPNLSTGPEIMAYVVDLEGLSDINIEVVPQFLWHVILKF